MRFQKRKINYKKYLIFVLSSTVVLSSFTGFDLKVLMVLILFSILVFINQLSLIYIVEKIFNNAKNCYSINVKNQKQDKREKFLVILLSVSKILMLALGITFGVHFVGDKIILPVINYVWQIFVLTLCSQRRA